jgi:glycerol-3-phosphate acyltransferase PlsY
MREAGRAAGILAFILDAGKGGAAVLLIRSLFPGDVLPPLGATAAVVGHMFPPWLAFRGGKGVATGLGAFAPLAPISAAAAVAAFVPVTALTRYVSLGSLAGTATLVASSFWLSPRPVALAALLSGTLIFWRHRSNLDRLLKGTERSLGGPS